MTENLFNDLTALYIELEAELSGFGLTCRACGECCHFDHAEHVLYVSRLEVQWLRRSAGVRPLPEPGRCPYQEGQTCTARDGRMLGCRLHFCAATGAVNERLEELSCTFHSRLKRIHDRYGIEWLYQPLHQALRE